MSAAFEALREPAPSVELHILAICLDVYLRDLPKKHREKMLNGISEELEFFASGGCIAKLRETPEGRAARAVALAAPEAWKKVEPYLRRPR